MIPFQLQQFILGLVVAISISIFIDFSSTTFLFIGFVIVLIFLMISSFTPAGRIIIFFLLGFASGLILSYLISFIISLQNFGLMS